ncbi:Flavinator of succinate dehydrogenase [Dillenia turbinata]|uniref:Flavinator of succinate dehydrogenase n=1 Tax=Dillenia turbinata TaxID=194707 RepID=A0AAN8USC8_9MAGN
MWFSLLVSEVCALLVGNFSCGLYAGGTHNIDLNLTICLETLQFIASSFFDLEEKASLILLLVSCVIHLVLHSTSLNDRIKSGNAYHLLSLNGSEIKDFGVGCKTEHKMNNMIRGIGRRATQASFQIHRLLGSSTNNASFILSPNHKIAPSLRRSHLDRVPCCSFTSSSTAAEIDLSTEESKRQLFNRLLYRSKQRGFLELDLVLGTWVEQHIHSLDENGIRALVQVLDLENPDLWKWLTNQEEPPEAIHINPVFSAVRDRVMSNLKSHAAPETRATPGQPWVRGWDDVKKGLNSPVAGNQ